MYVKRTLNDELSTFKSSLFPYKRKSNASFRYKAVVGLGGNVTDVRRRFERLFFEIKRAVGIELLQTSLILKNPPFGFKPQDDFFNSIMVVKTNSQPRIFLNYLMRLEKKFGRKRSFANAPRTLDLDIIFFDDRIVNTAKLTIPHPAWSTRQSVLIPLEGVSL